MVAPPSPSSTATASRLSRSAVSFSLPMSTIPSIGPWNGGSQVATGASPSAGAATFIPVLKLGSGGMAAFGTPSAVYPSPTGTPTQTGCRISAGLEGVRFNQLLIRADGVIGRDRAQRRTHLCFFARRS